MPFHYLIQNQGVNQELVEARIQFPPGLDYEIDSAGPPGDEINYDPAARILTWKGAVSAAGQVNLNFRAAAQPGYPPGQVELSARVLGLTSGQEWSSRLSLWVNMFGQLFPWISR
jgi:hypothetical protein